MRGAAAMLPLALAAGCFSPEARDGLPCSAAGDCPPGQECTAGVCSSESIISDAAVSDAPVTDAAPPDPPGPFGAPLLIPLTCPTAVPCADVRDPFLAGQTTSILFSNVVQASPGNQNLLYASRPGPEGAFAQAASLGGINTTLTEHSAFLSPDGASLWFSRQDVSGGIEVRPYDQILVSRRPGGVGGFETAEPIAGAVNTIIGDERSAQLFASAETMLFTRAAEATPLDHDVYLARFEGGQWNTIDRVEGLSAAGANDSSLALVEERATVFVIRDNQIHEAIWAGDDPTDIALTVVHDELDATPLDSKIGLWVSEDGSEVWFASNRTGAHQIWRAVRAAPTF